MKNKARLGQSTTEYILGLVVILAAMLSSNFVGKANEALGTFFANASNKISNATIDKSHIVDLSTCYGVNTRLGQLQNRLTRLNNNIDTLNKGADSVEDSITDTAVNDAVNNINSGANYYIDSANVQAGLAADEDGYAFADDTTADTYAAELPGMQANYASANCSSCESQYSWVSATLAEDPPGYVEPTLLGCYNLNNDIAFRTTQIPILRAAAEAHRAAALGYRAEETRLRAAGKEYSTQSDAVVDQANAAHDNAELMNTAAEDYDSEVEKLEAEISELKSDHAECF